MIALIALLVSFPAQAADSFLYCKGNWLGQAFSVKTRPLTVVTPTGNQNVNVIDTVGINYRFNWEDQGTGQRPVPPQKPGNCMIPGQKFTGAGWIYKANTPSNGNAFPSLSFSATALPNNQAGQPNFVSVSVDSLSCPAGQFIKVKVINPSANGVGWADGTAAECAAL